METKQRALAESLRLRGLTLREIGERLGVCRQRVGQILGKTGRVEKYKTKLMKKRMERMSKKSNHFISRTLGIPLKAVTKWRIGREDRHDISGGNAKFGKDIEDFVSGVLRFHKISHRQMKFSSTFDILLENGLRVDVKSRMPYKMKGIDSTMYSFNTHQDRRGRYCDFFILVTGDTKDVFVVPSQETKETSPIRFCWPTPKKGKPSKWTVYHNAYHLLDKNLIP